MRTSSDERGSKDIVRKLGKCVRSQQHIARASRADMLDMEKLG